MAGAGIRPEDVRAVHQAAEDFRALPSKAQQAIAKKMRAEYLPMLGREVAVNAAIFGAPGKADVLAAKDQRFHTGTNPGITIGAGKRQFSGGATSRDLIRPYEFGAARNVWTVTAKRDKKGRPVERRATNQFPAQRRTGWFVYPALAEVMPKVAAGWIYLVAEMIRDAVGAENG